MSLIHPAILFGLGLIAIPIVLHFLLRQKPKKLLFPALRLIQVWQRNNVRRMRLRHLGLLLLRIAVIALMVFALARPSLPSADYGLTNVESVSLAAVAGVVAAVYFGVMRWWKSQKIPQHVLTYRRTLLRGGAGAAFALMLLLLVVWPYSRRLHADLTSPQQQVKENVPVAAVFLFDTSASMDYRLESLTRLDRSREVSEKYLEMLPARSRVSVTDLSSDAPVLFQADPTSARGRIRGLKTTAASHSLNTRIRAAILTQEDDRRRTLEEESNVPPDLRQDRFVREIYLFTDMARSAWRMEDARMLHSEMERCPWISVYLIDVGVKLPTNVGISEVRLSRQTISEGGDLTVEATLDAVGVESAPRTVEILVGANESSLAKKGQSTVTVDTQAGARVAFTLPALKGPLVQGQMRLVTSDPLAADDVRFFTVTVRPAPEVLLVGELSEDVVYWREALAPSELERLGKARYRCQFAAAQKLESVDLSKFDAVCLMNVESPSEKSWDKLAKYVAAGGGVAVFTGSSRIDPVSYNSPAAQSFLPAQLAAHLKFRGEVFLDLQNLAHPIVRRFQDLGGAGELTSTPVYRYWKTEAVEGATVVVPYTDEQGTAAILERPHGQGRTLLFTTGVDLSGWAELPLARWSFVALADQTMQHLGRLGEGVYNYTAGDVARIPLDRRLPVMSYQLRKPSLQQLPLETTPESRLLTVEPLDASGQYEVVSGENNVEYTSGFSVNVPPGESDFTRITEADLDVLLGEKRYRVAEDLGSLERIVSTGRLGQEMFPFVVAFLLMAFLGEHLVANFFYEADQAAVHR